MIQENLFDLTEEQIEMSKTIYNGRVIKCLVAPYHSKRQLEEIVKYTPTTYLFPESEMTTSQAAQFISLVLATKKEDDEIRIITASQSIILDMIDGCVRILTEFDEIVDCPTKTFMANIHDIRYYVLENKHHQKNNEQKAESHKQLNVIIEDINNHSDNNLDMDESKFENYKIKIKMIGEPLIRNKLLEMLSRVRVKRDIVKSSEEVVAELSKLRRKLQKAIDSENFELAKEINEDIKKINYIEKE